MAIVYGQIESLKQIKSTLSSQGIRRFNSVSDIQNFITNYEAEKAKIYSAVEEDLKFEIQELQSKKEEYKIRYLKRREEIESSIEARTKKFDDKIEEIDSNLSGNPIKIYFRLLRRAWYQFSSWLQIRKYVKMLKEEETFFIKEFEIIKGTLSNYTVNYGGILSMRRKSPVRELEHTKQIVDSMYTLIAGAYGEHLVAKKLEVLSDNFRLFNGFSMEFIPPVYNRKTKDKIFSVQIDHLLLTNAGVFVIETKNWSKESVNRLDLRSPIDQIKRTSYAMFVALNGNPSKSPIKLNSHHWGEKEIPVRSVIAMINNKPTAKFRHVAIKTLEELNSYVTYFDPIFTDSELNEISYMLEKVRL